MTTPPEEPQQPQQSPQGQIQLTRFDGRAFVAQAVHLGGGAFINCTFDGCTLVLTNAPFVSQGCRFTRCNWRVEYDILWGSPETRSNLRRVLDLIDGAPDATGAPPPRL